MSEAYRIRQFYHVSDAKQLRFIEENLIPLLDKLGAYNLQEFDIDELMMTDEAMNLHMHEVDKLEDELNIIKNMLPGDWLVYTNKDESLLYAAKFKRLVRRPRKHLFVKHFAEVGKILKISIEEVPIEYTQEINVAPHLATLSLYTAKYINDIEGKIKEQKDNAITHDLTKVRTKHVRSYVCMNPTLRLKVRNQVLKQQGLTPKRASIMYSLKLESRINKNFKKGMTFAEIVVATLNDIRKSSNPPNHNKEIDKLCWKIFNERYPGQQPKKGQISEIRKEIIKQRSDSA